jgi:DNA repair protein RadC
MIAKLKHSVLSDQEVLEVMMYNAVPRKNTSDLAHRLLSTFETVEGVLEAPVGLLTLVDGVGDSLAAYLRCVGIFCEYYYRKKRKPYPVEYDQKEFLNFVAGGYAEMKVEVLDFYFLDKAREIIGRRRFSAMDPDRVPVAPDQLTELARACGATLAHAHARTGDRFAIAAYLGKSDEFDRQLGKFARTYADQNESDYARFMQALEAGEL